MPSSGGGGGFFGGMAGGMNAVNQFQQQQKLRSLLEGFNQGGLGRMMAFGNQNMQGPVAPIGGVSPRNQMMGGLRQLFGGLLGG